MASSSSQKKKNTKKPTELSPDPRNAYHGFHSEFEKDWHVNWFSQRTVIVEHAANIESFNNFEFMPTFARRVRWINFFKINIGDCNVYILKKQ